jgi:protein-disulfide isomerase
MKFVGIILAVLSLTFGASAQQPDEVLATAKDITIRLRDLSPETQKLVRETPARISKFRSDLLAQMANQRAVSFEAKALGITSGKLIARQKAKAAKPTEIEIRTVYNANKDALGGATLEEARGQIVTFLKTSAEQKAVAAYLTSLSTKYKITIGKNINSIGLAPAETVASVNGASITAKQFEDYARVQLFDVRADIAELVADDLREVLYQSLVAKESKTANVDASSLIAREVTNKMRDFTDSERITLEDAFAERLYKKYDVKIFHKIPEAAVENIAVGDSPATGAQEAPVTIIMFSDFQCSACAATHPILKRVIEQHADKIRFVVRNFPLESVHDDAFNAALAARAAKNQGKFFEYIEILYQNQDKLDAASLKKYAADLGLNAAQFDIDFKAGATAAAVLKDMADGESYQVSSTPTIFVNGVRVRNISAIGFRSAIAKALAK